MNDPCGLVLHANKYHLYYQYNPNETTWGPMHWGHATSTDLITWTEHPIALFPDDHYGMAFTGSVVVDEKGTLNAFYTGALPDRSLRASIQQQVRATSEDGFCWDIDRVVLPNPGQSDFRDPKVGRVPGSDRWFLILGVGREVRIYTSGDLVHWRRESVLDLWDFGARGVVECPDLFLAPIEGSESWVWVMTFSILGSLDAGSAASYYLVGDFDGRTFQPYTPASARIDHGSDFYALQTWAEIPGDQRRTIGVAYASNWAYAHQTPAGRWRGVMTLPREFSVAKYGERAYRLRQNPARELKVRSGPHISPTGIGETGTTAVRIDGTTNGSATVDLVFGRAGTIAVSLAADGIRIDRSKVDMGEFNRVSTPVVESVVESPASPGRSCDFTVVVDHSIIEVFLDHGELAATTLVFPRGTLTAVNLDDESRTAMERWQVRPIRPGVLAKASDRDKGV